MALSSTIGLLSILLGLDFARAVHYGIASVDRGDWTNPDTVTGEARGYSPTCAVLCQVDDAGVCPAFTHVGGVECDFGEVAECALVRKDGAAGSMEIAYNMEMFERRQVTTLVILDAGGHSAIAINETQCTDPAVTPPALGTLSPSPWSPMLFTHGDGLLICSHDSTAPTKCYTWDGPGDDAWTYRSDLELNHVHDGAGLVSLSSVDSAVVVGGVDTKKVEILDKHSGWRLGQDFPHMVKGMTVVAKNTNEVIALGGHIAGWGHSSYTYRYDILSDTWTQLPNMPFGGNVPDCARVVRQGRPVVLCFGTELNHPAHMVQLDLRTETWEDLDRATARNSCASYLTVVNNVLYVAAGNTGVPDYTHLNQIDVFDATADEWLDETTHPSALTGQRRSNFATLAIDVIVPK